MRNLTVNICDNDININQKDLKIAKNLVKKFIKTGKDYDETHPDNDTYYFTYLVLMNATAQELLSLMDSSKYKDILNMINIARNKEKEE